MTEPLTTFRIHYSDADGSHVVDIIADNPRAAECILKDRRTDQIIIKKTKVMKS